MALMAFSALDRIPTTSTGNPSLARAYIEPEDRHPPGLIEDHLPHLVGGLNGNAARVKGNRLANHQQRLGFT